MGKELIKVFRPKANELKTLLIQQSKSDCQTDAEVNRFLKIRKQQANRCNDHILTELIADVETFFEEEKGSLSLK